MSEAVRSLPKLRTELHIAEFDLEYVVWDPTCETVHLLRGLHAITFDACRTGATNADLIGEIVESTHVDDAHALVALDAALEHLAGLAMFSGLTERPP